MNRFRLERSARDQVTSHSGLALVGLALNRHTKLDKELKRTIPLRHGISHADMVRTYVGQLCVGKSDFDAVENVRNNAFFKRSLGIKRVFVGTGESASKREWKPGEMEPARRRSQTLD